jgi:hypothetical protein
VETAKAKRGIGFLFWNAANDYSKPFVAMPEMKAANVKEKDKFFRSDEAPRRCSDQAPRLLAPPTKKNCKNFLNPSGGTARTWLGL